LLGLPKGRLLIRHAHFRSPLFGTFPYPPTIPGMAGQRVFNPGANEGVARPGGHPGDGIWQMLQRLMGDRAPRKHEIREATAGIDPAELAQICFQVERSFQNNRLNGRADPWRVTQQALGRARGRG
jgi:hypothetical protein